MAPQHLYAEVGSPIPPQTIVPSHYNISSHHYGSPPKPDAGIYECVRNSVNLDQKLRPVEEVYEQPTIVASEKSDTTDLSEPHYKVPASVSLAASEYDVPKKLSTSSS